MAEDPRLPKRGAASEAEPEGLSFPGVLTPGARHGAGS